MNSGVYFFKKILNLIKNEPRSLETDILPKLISNRKFLEFMLVVILLILEPKKI